ncbi:phage holin family protein [Patescibacteria group bacterium]|nr:phage holin family protein [Patescibacteria group bacterium]
MGFLQRFSLILLANGLALYFVNFYIDGATISTILEEFILVAGALALINLFIRPIIRLALGPILLITLGLGGVIVNAVMIFILDLLLVPVEISNLTALILTSAVVSIVNLVISFSAKFI